ncbi:MAG: hypothetical protein HRT74_03920 [Flavobacteriales bacterium]|nr:hypothetical protein [Flavobacteriales bacterium]
MQPWKFKKSDSQIQIILDVHRENPFGDYLNRASLVSIGCCLENIIQCANSIGIEYELTLHDKDQKDDVVAEINILSGPKNQLAPDLWEKLLSRHTSRSPIPAESISDEKLNALGNTNWENGKLHLIHSKDQLDSVREIIAQADSIRFLNQKAHEEFFEDEVRWDEEHAIEKGDGLDMSKFFLRPAEYAGFHISKDASVMKQLREWETPGRGFGKLARQYFENTSAVGLVSVNGTKPSDFVRGGMHAQEAWLKSHELGLGFQPLSSPPYFFGRLNVLDGEGFSPREKDTLIRLRSEFNQIFSYGDDDALIMLFRLSSKQDHLSSVRKKYEDVVI